MTVKKLLGQRIKELRILKNLTQAQLAELVVIDPKHQSCIENGRNFPSADLLEKYAHVFRIDVSELLILEHHKQRAELENKLFELIKNCNDEDFKNIYKVIMALLQ